MSTKIKLIYTGILLFLLACNNPEKKGMFTVNGNLKNAPDQRVFLEQIFFDQQPPHVLDSAKITNGSFKVKATAPEEGLYRLRFEKAPGYIFINDNSEINFVADAKDSTLQSANFNTPANSSLIHFLMALDSMHSILIGEDQNIKELEQQKSDSLVEIAQTHFAISNEMYKNFLYQYIDTTKSPTLAIFALGNSQEIGIDSVKILVTALQKKFPKQSSVTSIAKQINDYVSSQSQQMQAQQQSQTSANIVEGQLAPDFTLPDVNGDPFKLSSLRGKYVLVDFWASWCGPCREENPNVVANYKQFKNKNFTVLGVSLDKDKSAWLKAIKDDGLEWKQLSDLKFWNNEAAVLYGIESIPFNVLIDPTGKIIGTSLRGTDLTNKLTEVLK